jgi:hypothetical protein
MIKKASISFPVKKTPYSFLFFLLMLTALSFPALAQTGGGGAALTTKIDSWKDTVKLVLNSAVAVFAIVGGFLIFLQYMQGNDNAQKNLIRFVIGLGVIGLIDLIVNVFIS